MTQNEKVLDYLKTHKGITTLDAFRDLGVARLASRICDLKRAGHVIYSDPIEVQNRDGEMVRVSFYRLIKEAKA